MAGISYQDAISGHRDQDLSYLYEGLSGPQGKDRNMAQMDGHSVCYSTLHCLFNFLGAGVVFALGYCCFAKKEFYEVDEILVRFY